MPAEVGQPAPAFTLKNYDREDFSLDDLKGRKSLVVFIPFPFSGICSGELCEIRDRLTDLSELDANVAVITCDTIFANGGWAAHEGFEFPILSDFWPHGAVAQSYGVFDERVGAARRVTFALDAEGVVRAVMDSGSLGTAREFEAYTEALRSI